MEFKYDIRDLKFILKEWLPTQNVLDCEIFKDYYSLDDIEPLLNQTYKIAREMINPLNAEADRVGYKFENGVVTPAPGFKDAYHYIQANGWGSSLDIAGSENRMPIMITSAIREAMSCACPALLTLVKLTTGAANIIAIFGTEADKKKFLPKMMSGDFQGTMCLTEPNAGSDVPDIITRSYATDDPYIYKIKGTKMFITGGDTGICENTIHMVLAKPEGAAPGSAGIGLYIVPTYWVNDDGSIGKFNDVNTVSLEHKMGLKAQSTALLNFGENDACYGIRLGPAPDEKGRSMGLPMMFNMMNESRISTGFSANTQAAACYAYASQYATERIQGRLFGVKGSDRVPIIKHEDIKRMLLDMKAHTEGIRAMIYKGFYLLDMSEHAADKEARKKYRMMAEVFTPLVKCYSSETALPVIAEAMQVLGGVGYTQEYPIEQYMRDSKILTIWEGTSFIQSQDLVTRKMRMFEGAAFTGWLGMINSYIEANSANSGFAREIANIKKGIACIEEVRKVYDSWYADFEAKRSLISAYAFKTLFVVAQVLVAELLLEQAIIAQQKLSELPTDHYERPFYKGKIASARYYANQVLPNVFTLTEIIKSEDSAVIDCGEETFIIN